MNTDEPGSVLQLQSRRHSGFKPSCTVGLDAMLIECSTICLIWWPIHVFAVRVGSGAG